MSSRKSPRIPNEKNLYSDIVSFYAADEARKTSREWDFGEHWREPGARGPWYRVSWIEDTGELYKYALAADFYGIDDAVEVIAVVPERTEVQQTLRGWGREHVELGSLDWLRKRVGDPAAKTALFKPSVSDEPTERSGAEG